MADERHVYGRSPCMASLVFPRVGNIAFVSNQVPHFLSTQRPIECSIPEAHDPSKSYVRNETFSLGLL
jgi:hypothetical protein